MCFYHDDYDWTAAVQERSTVTLELPTPCGECYRLMPVGSTMLAIYMQEAEECLDCEHGDCGCPSGKCCVCEEPSIGETFSYRRCADCELFLEAVSAAETEEGCTGDETRPDLGSMLEDVRAAGAAEAKRYFKKATKMSPELVKSGYLGWLWRKLELYD